MKRVSFSENLVTVIPPRVRGSADCLPVGSPIRSLKRVSFSEILETVIPPRVRGSADFLPEGSPVRSPKRVSFSENLVTVYPLEDIRGSDSLLKDSPGDVNSDGFVHLLPVLSSLRSLLRFSEFNYAGLEDGLTEVRSFKVFVALDQAVPFMWFEGMNDRWSVGDEFSRSDSMELMELMDYMIVYRPTAEFRFSCRPVDDGYIILTPLFGEAGKGFIHDESLRVVLHLCVDVVAPLYNIMADTRMVFDKMLQRVLVGLMWNASKVLIVIVDGNDVMRADVLSLVCSELFLQFGGVKVKCTGFVKGLENKIQQQIADVYEWAVYIPSSIQGKMSVVCQRFEVAVVTFEALVRPAWLKLMLHIVGEMSPLNVDLLGLNSGVQKYLSYGIAEAWPVMSHFSRNHYGDILIGRNGVLVNDIRGFPDCLLTKKMSLCSLSLDENLATGQMDGDSGIVATVYAVLLMVNYTKETKAGYNMISAVSEDDLGMPSDLSWFGRVWVDIWLVETHSKEIARFMVMTVCQCSQVKTCQDASTEGMVYAMGFTFYSSCFKSLVVTVLFGSKWKGTEAGNIDDIIFWDMGNIMVVQERGVMVWTIEICLLCCYVDRWDNADDWAGCLVTVASCHDGEMSAVGMHLRHFMVHYLLILITMGFVRHVPSLNLSLLNAPE